MNRIIALAGRAGSGKSTVGQWLVEHRGAVEVSFAAPLKRLAMEVFGFSERQVFGTQQDKETTVGDVRVAFGEEVKAELAHAWSSGRAVSPREMLIRLGDGARRHIAPDVWIRAALRQIDELPDGTLAVVTDVRYGNEAQAITRSGRKRARSGTSTPAPPSFASTAPTPRRPSTGTRRRRGPSTRSSRVGSRPT